MRLSLINIRRSADALDTIVDELQSIWLRLHNLNLALDDPQQLKKACQVTGRFAAPKLHERK